MNMAENNEKSSDTESRWFKMKIDTSLDHHCCQQSHCRNRCYAEICDSSDSVMLEGQL